MQAKDKQTRELVAAMKRLQKLELGSSFDPVNPESRPTQAQQEVLDDLVDVRLPNGEFRPKIQYRMVIAGNQSGKSQLAAREIAWIVNGDHPSWTRPERWGDEPLLILVAGQDRRNMEIELWAKKIKPFLKQEDWKEVRVAGVLNYAEHRKQGHKIIFMSHNDSSESARQHMQGYVAHYVWLDEMPRNIIILEELQRRVDSRRGYLLATFTPKFKNEAIKKVVDSLTPPIGKKYRLSKLDNPLYASQRENEMQKLIGYTESYRNTVLYGDWHIGDNSVYQFDAEKMLVDEVPFYSTSWRHVVSIDPATSSHFGHTVWAEEPGTGIWYLISDAFISAKLSPDEAVQAVEQLSRACNKVKRICDPHENWFIAQAAKARIFYQSPNKNNRKLELIKGLQIALSSGKIRIASWCSNFIEEIQGCQWSETAEEKIVNSAKYHTLDTAQYFVDLMPPYNEENRQMEWHEELRIGNEKRKKREKAGKNLPARVRPIFSWGRNTLGNMNKRRTW